MHTRGDKLDLLRQTDYAQSRVWEGGELCSDPQSDKIAKKG